MVVAGSSLAGSPSSIGGVGGGNGGSGGGGGDSSSLWPSRPHCPVVLLLSVVVLLSTLRAVARSGGIGVLSWRWLILIAELEPKKRQENIK